MAQESLIANCNARSQSFHTFSNDSSSSVTMNSPQSFRNLECRVCEEGFSLSGDRVPRLLLCGHTLCHVCLMRLNTCDSNILCPFDRQPTPIGSSGVWGLKKNFALLELLEKLLTLDSDSVYSPEVLIKQKELGIACDEEDNHVAIVYCTVCASHLCMECSKRTHATKTLHKHKRIPLSEKPREKPKCPDHSSHPVEFVCIEESCHAAPLMCFICKDYKHTKHKHVLLEQETERIRIQLTSAMRQIKTTAKDLTETAHTLESVARQLEYSDQNDVALFQTIPQQSNTEGSIAEVTAQCSGRVARQKVRQYFDNLRDLLNQQEAIAMRALDTHIRERLCSIRQQQEDLAAVLSQMVSVVVDVERLLQQDDGRLVLASRNVVSRVNQVTSQPTQLNEIIALNPDPSITITFTKDNRIHIGARIEMRIVTLGLDGAGKTSILFRLKNGEFVQTIPTIGFNVETIEYENIKFTIWDVGGQPKLRPLWRHYYYNTQAVIFVIDVNCRERFVEAQTELTKLLNERELKEASLLIFANRMAPCNNDGNLSEDLGLATLCLGRSWHLQPCNALTGFGLQQGLDWLTRQLVPLEILNEFSS